MFPLPVEPAQAERRAEAPAAPFLFPPANRVLEEEQEELPSFGNRLKKWLPLAAVLLLAGGAVWWVSQTASRQSSNAPLVVTNEPARPLGLSVEPMGQGWQVSWNPNATALHDAHSVQLFVRDGDDQTRVDLSPHDRAAGIYTYPHAGNDATFRLEVARQLGAGLCGIFPVRAQRGQRHRARSQTRAIATVVSGQCDSSNRAESASPRATGYCRRYSSPHHEPDTDRCARAYRRPRRVDRRLRRS